MPPFTTIHSSCIEDFCVSLIRFRMDSALRRTRGRRLNVDNSNELEGELSTHIQLKLNLVNPSNMSLIQDKDQGYGEVWKSNDNLSFSQCDVKDQTLDQEPSENRNDDTPLHSSNQTTDPHQNRCLNEETDKDHERYFDGASGDLYKCSDSRGCSTSSESEFLPLQGLSLLSTIQSAGTNDSSPGCVANIDDTIIKLEQARPAPLTINRVMSYSAGSLLSPFIIADHNTAEKVYEAMISSPKATKRELFHDDIVEGPFNPLFSDKPLDPYEVLQIPFEANYSEIRNAYCRLSLTTHPSRSLRNISAGTNTNHVVANHQLFFALLAAAFETLADQSTRQSYDCEFYTKTPMNALGVSPRLVMRNPLPSKRYIERGADWNLDTSQSPSGLYPRLPPRSTKKTNEYYRGAINDLSFVLHKKHLYSYHGPLADMYKARKYTPFRDPYQLFEETMKCHLFPNVESRNHFNSVPSSIQEHELTSIKDFDDLSVIPESAPKQILKSLIKCNYLSEGALCLAGNSSVISPKRISIQNPKTHPCTQKGNTKLSHTSCWKGTAIATPDGRMRICRTTRILDRGTSRVTKTEVTTTDLETGKCKTTVKVVRHSSVTEADEDDLAFISLYEQLEEQRRQAGLYNRGQLRKRLGRKLCLVPNDQSGPSITELLEDCIDWVSNSCTGICGKAVKSNRSERSSSV